MNMQTEAPVEPVEPTSAPVAATPESGAESGHSSIEGASVEPIETGKEASTTSEEGTNLEPTPQKKAGGFRKRIDELVRKNHDTSRQNAILEQRLDDIRVEQQKAQLDGTINAPPPKLEDYTTPEDYYEAIESWKKESIDSYQKGQEESSKRAKAANDNAKAQQDYQAKVAQAVEKYPDFVDIITNPELPNLPEVSPAGFQAVIESDNFADVAVYLAKNPVELYNLGSLSPIQAIKEVAKIEMRLAAKPTSQNQKLAISPPTEVGGQASSVKQTGDMSTEEWMKNRNNQLQKK